MKAIYFIALLAFFTTSVFSQTATKFDLHKLAKKDGLDVHNRDMKVIKEDGYAGIG